jgi:hypothetical protein
MTITLNLTPEQELILLEKANAAGIADPANYLLSLIDKPQARFTRLGGGKELLNELDAAGLLVGYGNPAESSTEIARRIRHEAESRHWQES